MKPINFLNNNFIKFTILIISVLFFTACEKDEQADSTITIGTCEVMDIVNTTGEILARIINTDIVRNDIIAEAIETKGAGENIRELLTNKLDCGLTNDISAVIAYNGDKTYAKYPNHSDLRSMCSFFTESIVFIVRENSRIKNFKDIIGKKIAITAAEEASIGDIAKYMLQFYNIKEKDFTRLTYGLEKSVLALDKGEIDGFLFVTSQPSPYLLGLTNTKGVKCRFVQFSKELMSYLKTKIPSLTYTKIPADMYPNSINQKDITTLGCHVLLLTMKEMKDDIVYYLTKEICTYFPEYESVHPSFEEVTKKSMAEHLTLPVHPGALKYYKEIGIAKYIPKDLLPKSK